MTKTFHRAEEKPRAQRPPPSFITISFEELKQIKEAHLAEGIKKGFDQGIIYIVNEVETILCKELGFNSREELVHSGKMPAIWIATLVKYHGEGHEERLRRKAEKAEVDIRKSKASKPKTQKVAASRRGAVVSSPTP